MCTPFATHKAEAAALVLLALLVSPHVEAHPFALSRFDAFTEGRDLRFEVALDATSLLDMIQRSDPQQGDAALFPADLRAPALQKLVFDYFEARFRVGNGDLPCAPRRPAALTVDELGGKVHFRVRFRCPTDLGVVVLESTLFAEEETPHDLLGNFHHVRALERVFFSRTNHRARLDLARLPQVMPAEIDSGGAFRSAEPPPGVFDERLRRPVKGVPLTRNGAAGVTAVLGTMLFVLGLWLAAGGGRRSALLLALFALAHGAALVLVERGWLSLAPGLGQLLVAGSLVAVAWAAWRRGKQAAGPGLAVAGGLAQGAAGAWLVFIQQLLAS